MLVRAVHPPEHRVLLVVDFDNVLEGGVQPMSWLSLEPNKVLDLALKLKPAAERIDVRIYRGGLRRGISTSRALALQAHLSSVTYSQLYAQTPRRSSEGR